MKIWLVKDGEYLPIQEGGRMMRTWMLAEALLEQGHSVLWWSSTFSHQWKKLLAEQSMDVKITDDFNLKMIYAGAYTGNLSVARLTHHRRLAREFTRQAEVMEKPDIIVCSYPIIDLADRVIKYANENEVPIILDVRDLWPSIFPSLSSKKMKPFAYVYSKLKMFKTRKVLRGADRLVAVSEGFLGWALENSNRENETCHKVFLIGYPGKKLVDRSAIDEDVKFVEMIRSLEGKKVFTFIGSFGCSYELGLIPKVAEKIVREGRDDIQIVLAGDGDQAQAISKTADKLPNITLTGWIDRTEIDDLLEITYIGLSPIIDSFDGRVPNKPFEYFAHGLPVLSSLNGEMARLISKDNLGFSYKCGDADRLARLMMDLADNEELRNRLSKNVRRAYKEKFVAEPIYKKYAMYVCEVANELKC